MPDALMTAREAADYLHVHLNTLRRWTIRGDIPSAQLGTRGDRRFRLQDLEDFIAGSLVPEEPTPHHDYLQDPDEMGAICAVCGDPPKAPSHKPAPLWDDPDPDLVEGVKLLRESEEGLAYLAVHGPNNQARIRFSDLLRRVQAYLADHDQG